MAFVSRALTSADQLGDVAIAGHFAWRNLLHGAVDCVEEGLCFGRAGHGILVTRGLLWRWRCLSC